MSTATVRFALDFDELIPTCWKYHMTSLCANASAENTIYVTKVHLINQHLLLKMKNSSVSYVQYREYKTPEYWELINSVGQ